MKVNLLLVCLGSCCSIAFGQGGLATITGTIADPSGAVIANAPIEVRNVATGRLYAAASTATGNYTVPQLPVGDYDMVVTVAGFKSYNRQGFHLSAQQTLREDVVLEVGGTAEAVTVTAEASLLKTESSELVHNVTVSQMNNLPILTVGGIGSSATSGFRDPFALAAMIPGIQYTANSQMVVNGNPDDSIQIRVEGQTSGNTGGLRQYTQQTQPSVDAIQEVAVQTSNYAAEYGTAGGAVLNVVMKGGSNRYSGSVYDYAANEALNAHQPYTGQRNAQKRHDYGFTLGGPIKIPKLYDGSNRTFFFWSWEQFRENVLVTTSTPTVPIPAYRSGDFSPLWTSQNNQLVRAGSANYLDPLGNTIRSGTIFDPLTTTPAPGGSGTYRTAFPGNIIPPSRFDPISTQVLALVPQPKGPNADRGQIFQNFQNPWLSHRTSELPSVKIDQTIGSNGRLSGYWQHTGTTSQYSFPNGNAEGFPEPITIARGTFIYTKTYRVNYDHTLSPTLLLHLGAGWNSNNFNDKSPVTDYDAFTELGLRGATLNRTFPQINTGTAGTGGNAGGMSQIGTGGQGNSFERRPSGNANINWVKGNHTLKIGAEYRLEKYPAYAFTGVSGNYSFGNSTVQTSLQGINTSQGFTGFNFASFMLGDLSAASLAVVSAAGTSKSQWGLFAQDTWKVTRKLTLDYGVRWDYGTYAREHYGRNANFGFDVLNPSADGHPGGQVYEATCGCNFAANYPYAIGPRLGVAYQIDTKTVLRAGFGVVYTATGTASGSSTRDANAGSPGFGETVGRFADGMPANVQPIWPNFNPNAGQPVGSVSGAPTFLDPNAGRPARQIQWSVGLQRELSRNLVVEASYVANRGSWWSAGGLAPINVLSESDITNFGFTDFTSTNESRLLTTQIRSLSSAQRSTLASRGIFLPYSNFPHHAERAFVSGSLPAVHRNHQPRAGALGQDLVRLASGERHPAIQPRPLAQRQLHIRQESGPHEFHGRVQPAVGQESHGPRQAASVPHDRRVPDSKPRQQRHEVLLQPRCFTSAEQLGSGLVPAISERRRAGPAVQPRLASAEQLPGPRPRTRAAQNRTGWPTHEPLVGRLGGLRRQSPHRSHRYQLPLLRSDQERRSESGCLGERP